MDIVLFAGKIGQWRLPGDPARGSDIDAPGDDLTQGPYFVETNKSPPINLLFETLFDLIICRTSKMGLGIPCASEGLDLDAIFAEKVPMAKGDEREKWLVCAEILAYLKYLVYSAAFKDPTAEPRGSIHAEFCRGWRRTFCLNEDLISRKMQKQPECWCVKHPPSNRRVLPKDYDKYIGDSDGEHPPAGSGFTMMLLLHHRKRMLNEGLAMVAFEFE